MIECQTVDGGVASFCVTCEACQHVGIMTWHCCWCPRPRCHTFGFLSITFEGMYQFHSKFTEG